MAINGYKWLQMATNGYKWLQMAINGYKWQFSIAIASVGAESWARKGEDVCA